MIGGLTGSSRFKIATRSGFLGCLIDATGDFARMHEVLPQMGNVLEEDNLVAECNVVEQDEVLVHLAHVAHVRDDRHTKLPTKQAYGDEFTDAGHTHRIHLDESCASGLQIILEHDAVWDVFPECQPDGSDCFSQGLVAEDVIRM